MRKFTVTVNGQDYDVVVKDSGAAAAPAAAAPAAPTAPSLKKSRRENWFLVMKLSLLGSVLRTPPMIGAPPRGGQAPSLCPPATVFCLRCEGQLR